MSLNLSSYKGTRDIYPEDMRLRRYIFDTWARVAESFGYEEYDSPLLEPLELYAAKSGEEIVNDQTYKFTDRGERTVAIRPEMTPSIARMVAARRQEIALPARLYSISNFMRYERPQNGREREFWQLNTDIFGAAGIEADAEIICLGERIMRAFGATDDMFTIRISDRQWIDFVMRSYLELDEENANKMIKLFDRFSKMSREAFDQMAIEIFSGNDQNSSSCAKSQDPANLDMDSAADKSAQNDGNVNGAAETEFLAKINSLLVDNIDDLPAEVRDQEFEQIRKVLEILQKRGVTNAAFDPTLMRGFDYYTGIVFEFFDNAPENNRAMFGGGRYDGLVGLFGVEDLPVVGVAPGELTTALFLKSWNLVPELKPTTDVVLIPLGDVEIEKVADELRAAGVNIAVDFTDRKVEKKIKAAVKAGVPYVLFIGEEEIESGEFTLKNLATQEERKLNVEQITKYLL